MKARATQGAGVEETSNGWILRIPKGDSSGYRLAQLDDYSQLPRREFPHRSLDLSLRARTSAESASGTWGFGVWNDPFGMSLGFGGSPFRLPTLPNAAWFFYASPQNYLSFRDPSTAGFETQPSAQGVVANGFLAQTFRVPRFYPSLIGAGLALPFSPQTTRRMLGRVIWIDNQFAAFTPEGKISFGVLENPEAWLEVEDVKISNM